MSAHSAPAPGTSGGATTPEARPGRGARLEVAVVSIVLAACAPLLWPLLQPGVPATHDGFLHVQRLIALDAAAREGVLFGRWLPDLAYGYGQPLLLYYAPLSYVPALGLRLLGFGFVASFELTSGLALALSALSMYLLARSLFGPLAAGAAAVVYAALPYQMIDLYVRGALAESWAFVWLPLAAWGLVTAGETHRPYRLTLAAVALACLILTHNVTALLALPALALLVALLQVSRGRADWKLAALSVCALALGVGLAGWFWLPALAERQLVQIDQTIEPKLFASFFLPGWPPFRLDPIFDYKQPTSSALGYPIYWPQLGLVQTVVSALGAFAVGRLRGIPRVIGLWAIILVIGGWLLQTRPFTALYELVPLLLFVQFPWRLLTLVGLGSALLSATLVDGLTSRPALRAAMAGMIVAASLATALLGLDPERTPVEDRFLSTETVLRSELAEWGLGGTHSGEYLPVSSGQRNAARLRRTMLDAGPPRTTEPIPIIVEGVTWRPGRIVAEVVNSGQATERLLVGQFAFDGWYSKVDGLAVRTEATGQLGLASVRVMPGHHTVELSWNGAITTARQLGISMSGASVVGLALLLLSGRLAVGRRWLWGAATATLVAAGFSWWAALTPAVAAQNGLPPSWRPVDETLALIDTRTDSSRLATDRLILTTMTWLVRRTPPTGYRAFVEATAGDGAVHRALWIYEPLSRLWEPGQLTQTTVAVRVPATMPPGHLDLALVFEAPAGLPPIPLGSLSLPAAPPNAAANLPTGAEVAIIPGRLDLALPAESRWTATPTRPLDLAFTWTARVSAPDVERELLVRAVVNDVSGRAVPVSDVRRPGDWFAPLPFWQADERVPQRLRVRPPATLAPGEYPLSLEVYPRDLARGGAAETGASSANVRGRPLTTIPLGTLVVTP